MKTTISILILALSLSLCAQDIAEKEIKSEVNAVTVFFESAQITREKKLTVQSGKTVLKFTDLSPYIDAKSIKAKVNGQVNVLSVNHQQNYLSDLDKSDELLSLEKKLSSISKKIKLEETYQTIIMEEIQFLQANRVLGGKNQEVSVTSLREASEFYGEKLTALKLKEIERRDNIDKLRKEYNKISRQLNTITSKKEFASGEVLLTVNAKESCSIDIDLSYVVGNAGWFPGYDIKAESVNKPLEIVYKANLRQDTKVDWKDVRLSFSSNNPKISSIAPELQTYYLNYGSVPPGYETLSNQIEGVVTGSDGLPLPGVTVMIKGTTIGVSTDMNGKYSLTLPPGANTLKYSFIGCITQEIPARTGYMNIRLEDDMQSLDEVVVMGYGSKRKAERVYDDELAMEAPSMTRSLRSSKIKTKGNSSMPMPVAQVRNQTSVEFEISMPYSVKSNNKNYLVEMVAYEVTAYYEYLSIPKIDPDAFLIANIDDWESLNLLAGEANLFFEETFVGKSILDVRFASDTISLSLGRDKNVSVKRTKVKDLKSKKFIGTKQEDTRAWEIDIRNNKSSKINMLVLDQVPVPMNEEIELTLSDKSGARYNDKNGEIKWQFSLAPATKKELKLKYSIKYPKNKQLIIE